MEVFVAIRVGTKWLTPALGVSRFPDQAKRYPFPEAARDDLVTARGSPYLERGAKVELVRVTTEVLG